MVKGLWGYKIGMTQAFSEQDVVVPVTAIRLGNWVVTRRKTKDRDGYDAIQLGSFRKRYQKKEFLPEWLKNSKKYFNFLKEVRLTDSSVEFEIGKPLNPASVLEIGNKVHVFGTTKGRGFAGVVKRHGFSGGPASHGPRMGRRPGAIGGARKQGKVPKGKKLPGHMGVVHRVVQNLKIIKYDSEQNVIFVKGSIPGSSGSLVFLQKAWEKDESTKNIT